MIQQVTIREITNKFDYSLTSTHGGFIAYLKLLEQLLIQIQAIPHTFSRGKLWAALLIKSPYYLFIKPLGWFFKSKVRYQGVIQIRLKNRQLSSYSIKSASKWKVFYFTGIPFWVNWILTSTDEQYILNQSLKDK